MFKARQQRQKKCRISFWHHKLRFRKLFLKRKNRNWLDFFTFQELSSANPSLVSASKTVRWKRKYSKSKLSLKGWNFGLNLNLFGKERFVIYLIIWKGKDIKDQKLWSPFVFDFFWDWPKVLLIIVSNFNQ